MPDYDGTANGSESYTPDADWSIENNLTQALRSPEALAGATITVDVAPANDSRWHYESLDGVVLRVTYRSPLKPRPLSGCATIRPSSYRPPAWYQGLNSSNGTQGYDWLDGDWGQIKSATATQSGNVGWLTGDQAFGNNSGNGSGNGPAGDDTDCAFFDVYSNNGDGTNSAYNKIHVAGMVYAPSGAVQLAGRDNRASWVTSGVIARQVTALRWKSGGDNGPAFGNSTPDHNDRFVEIDVCKHGADCTQAANVLLREYVQFMDYNGADVGGKVKVLSYMSKPPS